MLLQQSQHDEVFHCEHLNEELRMSVRKEDNAVLFATILDTYYESEKIAILCLLREDFTLEEAELNGRFLTLATSAHDLQGKCEHIEIADKTIYFQSN